MKTKYENTTVLERIVHRVLIVASVIITIMTVSYMINSCWGPEALRRPYHSLDN